MNCDSKLSRINLNTGHTLASTQRCGRGLKPGWRKKAGEVRVDWSKQRLDSAAGIHRHTRERDGREEHIDSELTEITGSNRWLRNQNEM